MRGGGEHSVVAWEAHSRPRRWIIAKIRSAVPVDNKKMLPRKVLTESLHPHLNRRGVCISWRREDSTLRPTRGMITWLSMLWKRGARPQREVAAIGGEASTHWNSDSSTSKSTASTPTSSRLSSTIDARNWSVASSRPRKRDEADFGGMMQRVV